MAAERLQKYLARAGVASRRHAEELITAGRVTVNNETVTELGSRVEPGTDLVAVDGTLVTPPDVSSYYLLYKPIGVVTTLSDPQGRPTVGNYVEETGKRLFPVGRLDYDAEGALLFTDDGALAHKLTHPSFQVPRMYLAKVKGVPDAATLDKLRGGVRLEDGMATPLSVDVFEAAERNTWLKIVVAEGRPHLIKRLCAAVGHPVVRLFRPAYAGIGVEGMRPGELRALKKSEVEQLGAVSEGRAQPAAVELKLPPRRHGRAAPGFDADEAELSMDDESPAPRKASTAEARPEKRERKPASAGGAGPARFSRTSGGDAARPPRKAWGADAEGAPRGRAAGAGRPVRKEWGAGGEDKPRGRSFDAGGDKPRGRSFGAGGDDKPRGRSFGAGGDDKPRRSFGAGGDDKPRGRSFGAGGDDKPRRSFGAGRPERGAGSEDKPRGRSFGAEGEDTSRGRGYASVERGAAASRPVRKTWGAGGDEGAAPRAAGRPVRKAWGAGGAEARAPRGEGRPERSEGGAGAGRPVRKAWGAGGDEGAAPRSRGAAGEDRPRARSFGAGAAGRPERSEGGESRPRARGYGVGGAGAGRPERREFSAGRGEGRPPRRTFGGDEGGARPERREWKAGGTGARGAGRPERREFSPRGGASGGPRGAGRPERREFSPRGPEGAAPRRGGPGRIGFGEGARGAGSRPARKEWSPTDARGNPNERVVRGGARRGPPGERSGGERSGGFKKERSGPPRFSSGGPRGGAGRPPPRGPRRPR